jgi:hypothetical protein
MQIAKELNSKGISSPRNKKWGKTVIRAMLNNEAYAGTFVWGRNSKRGLEPIRVENACPVIIERCVFDMVLKTMQNRKSSIIHPKRAASRFLLSGMSYCGLCGKALTGAKAKSGKFSYYVCGTLNKKGSGSCQARYINSQKFETQVIQKIKDGILTEENLARIVEMVNQDLDVNSIQFQNEMTTVMRDLQDTNHRLERLYDAIETGNVSTADLAPRIHELKLRVDKLLERKLQLDGLLADRRVELASPEVVKRFTNEMRKVLELSEFTEKKAFLRSFIEKISVMSDHAVIKYKAPINGLIEDKIGVLAIVQHGGQ